MSVLSPLVIGGQPFTNRLFLGTGKFASGDVCAATLRAAECQLVTAALTRVDADAPASDAILRAIQASGARLLLNTSGARNAEEALRLAHLAKAAGCTWIKLEIHPDARWLLPDPIETLRATEALAREGFTVLPYMPADPVLAKRLEAAGAAALMPLGAPIGSNRGLQTREMLAILIEQATLPVVVDAGLGLPSQATEAIELGADALLINTAVAAARDPVSMARAFRSAIDAATLALQAQPPVAGLPEPTSPLEVFA